MSGARTVRVLCLLAPLLAGCSSGNQPKNDPLVGFNAPPLPKEGSAAARGGGPDRPLPGLTSPSGATSPAALTAGGVAQLDGARDLRIGEKDPASSWGAKTAGVSLGKPIAPGEV